MDKTKKILALAMSGAMCFSSCVPAFAASSNVNSVGSIITDSASETVKGKDTSQGTETKYNTVTHDDVAQADVYVTQKSSFTVKIPKVIVLNGKVNEENSGIYQVDVSGNIAGDEAITVIPTYDLDDADATHFEMSQKGKDNITATVAQDKNVFTYATGVTESGKDTTTGKVTATGMTAGSWHGVFNFKIENNTEPKYYSSFAQAVADANASTLNNADLQTGSDENAEAAVLNLADGSSLIRLCSDVNDLDSITISKNININLNDYTLNFKPGCSLTYADDLTIYNGSLNTYNTAFGIQSQNKAALTDTTLVIDDVDYTHTNDDTMTSNCVAIVNAGKTIIDDSDITVVNNGGANTMLSTGLYCGFTDNTINSSNIEVIDNGKGSVYSVYAFGGANVESSDSNITANSTKETSYVNSNDVTKICSNRAIYVDKTSSATINSGTYTSKGIDAYSYAVASLGTLNIYGGSFYADNKTKLYATGIFASGGILNVKEKSPLFCYGLHSGLDMNNCSATVDGGLYQSPDHGGMYIANGNSNVDIKNVTCKNVYGSPLYSEEEHTGDALSAYNGHMAAVYFGADSNITTETWTVNVSNSEFYNETKPATGYAIGAVLKNTDNYTPPVVNFTNCIIKSAHYPLRIDTGGAVNLIGDCQLIGGKGYNNVTTWSNPAGTLNTENNSIKYTA